MGIFTLLLLRLFDAVLYSHALSHGDEVAAKYREAWTRIYSNAEVGTAPSPEDRNLIETLINEILQATDAPSQRVLLEPIVHEPYHPEEPHDDLVAAANAEADEQSDEDEDDDLFGGDDDDTIIEDENLLGVNDETAEETEPEPEPETETEKPADETGNEEQQQQEQEPPPPPPVDLTVLSRDDLKVWVKEHAKGGDIVPRDAAATGAWLQAGRDIQSREGGAASQN